MTSEDDIYEYLARKLNLKQWYMWITMAGVVVIAIDASEQAEKAFQCKYIYTLIIIYFSCMCVINH